jgi:hypothetical protein
MILLFMIFFEITEHGKQMIMERLGCKEHKIEKILQKAFVSKELVTERDVVNPRFYENKYWFPTIYRKMMGMLFIFRKSYRRDCIIFITVYPPRPKRDKINKIDNSLKKVYHELNEKYKT